MDDIKRWEEILYAADAKYSANPDDSQAKEDAQYAADQIRRLMAANEAYKTPNDNTDSAVSNAVIEPAVGAGSALLLGGKNAVSSWMDKRDLEKARALVKAQAEVNKPNVPTATPTQTGLERQIQGTIDPATKETGRARMTGFNEMTHEQKLARLQKEPIIKSLIQSGQITGTNPILGGTGRIGATETGVLAPPEEIAAYKAAKAAQNAPLPPAPPSKLDAVLKSSPVKMATKAMPYVGAYGVGSQLFNAGERGFKGDYPGAAISAIGAAGSAASMIPTLPTMALGTIVGQGAEELNKYRDEGWPYTKKERPDPSNINDDPNRAAFGVFPQMDVKDKNKFAAGGLAQLAEGKSVAEMANEQLNPQRDERELSSAPFALNINQLPPAPERGSVGDDIALAELMHRRRFGDGSLKMGARGISVNTPQGRINKLSGVNAAYEHPSGVSVGVEQPFNNPTMKTRANINYTRQFGIGGSVEKLIAHINKAGKTPVVPAPNRWFANPEKFPQVQGMVNKTLEHSGLPREEFHSGAFIDPRTGEVLDRNIYDELGVVIDPKTGKPMMSAGKQSGLEVLDPKTGSYTKSNLVRKSLFAPTGGDELLKRLPFIATVEKGGTHHYGLGTEYATPAELYNTMKGDNPTLRPRSRGDVFGMGDVVGQAMINNRGIPRDIYESLFIAPQGSDVPGVKLNKSAGGHIEGYKGGSSVSLFDEQGNPIRQDENAPTQADIDYEKMLAEQNSTPSPKFTARNRAGQPVDPTANIVGPAVEGLGNTIYGAGRGALTAMAGLPGDINKLITDNIGTAFNAPALPTTEEIQNFLPGQPTSHEGKISQKLGEFVPVNPMPAIRVAGKGARALGETAAEKILTGQPMVPGAGFLNPEMMFATKPKGGNFYTNLGSEAPLKEQGALGRHLDQSLIDPKTEWYRQLDDDARKAYLDYDLRYERERMREKAFPLMKEKAIAESLHDEQNRINEFTNFWNQSPYNPNKIRSFDDIKEKSDAYNKWLLSNYKNYITKQMGTGVQTDPVLAEIDKANSSLFSIRKPDGTLRVSPKDAEMSRNAALKSFLFKKENDASLPQNQYIGKQTATSEGGKTYEDIIDHYLISSMTGGDTVKYPGFKNLHDRDRVYDLMFGSSSEKMGLDTIKDSLLKDVLSGKMSVDKLPNTSMGALVKKLIDEDAIRIKELNKDKGLYNAYKVERFNALPAQTQFADGSKMIEFSKDNTTDPLQLLRDLGVDCKDLNHCVVSSHRDSKARLYIPALEPHTGLMPKGSTGKPAQSYYQSVLDGRTNLLSLRDTTGTAQATLQRGADGVEQIKGYGDKEVKPEFIPHIKQWLNTNAGNAPVTDLQNLPGVFDIKSTELLSNENFTKYPWLEQFVTDRISKIPFNDVRDYEVGKISNEDFMSRIFPNMPRFVDIDDIKNADSFLTKPEFKKGGHVSPAWQRSEGKSESGGLNAAGRASYHRETGGTLKAPQPEGGSRRDSFCARMEGMKKKLTSSETARDPDSRINKSLRKWNC